MRDRAGRDSLRRQPLFAAHVIGKGSDLIGIRPRRRGGRFRAAQKEEELAGVPNEMLLAALVGLAAGGVRPVGRAGGLNPDLGEREDFARACGQVQDLNRAEEPDGGRERWREPCLGRRGGRGSEDAPRGEALHVGGPGGTGAGTSGRA